MIRLIFVAIFFLSSIAFAELPDFVALNDKVSPAVVNISTTQNPQIDPNDPMMQFLEHFYGLQPRSQPLQSLGSGFIIDSNGLIITNNHVVDEADEIEVQLANDDIKYKAEVIGKDPKTDIALIKIKNKKKLPYLKLGSSNDLKVGAWVAAIGNPLGFNHSITKGIISGKGRDVGEVGLLPFIQTDASINPGNSGGPLVNLEGEVVGVNTFIIRGAQGLGFAVPIDGVKQILPDLKSKGKVIRGYLGITFSPVDLRAAKYLNLKEPIGAIVGDVIAGSPADKAGLKPYDVILKFGKVEIDTADALSNAVARTKIGDKVNLQIWREGKQQKLSVNIEIPPYDFGPNKKASRPANLVKENTIEAPHNLGFYYGKVDNERAQSLGITATNKPVIIDVKRNSPAARAGLSRGDIILDINRNSIRSLKDVSRHLKKGSNLMRVQRGSYRVALFIED